MEAHVATYHRHQPFGRHERSQIVETPRAVRQWLFDEEVAVVAGCVEASAGMVCRCSGAQIRATAG